MVNGQMQRIAFLDRDGVINQQLMQNGKPRSPKNLTEIKILGGVVQAVLVLKAENFVPVIVTNQPDVARGLTTLENVMEINRKICEKIGVEYVFTCPHDDSDLCKCRKPLNGLLTSAGKKLEIPLRNCIMVGDRLTDVEAGLSIGAKCYLIDHSESPIKSDLPFIKVGSLLDAAMKERIKVDG
jgi:D-glycero-D-manno-heptose 1,7-bisphosphate phosphatase